MSLNGSLRIKLAEITASGVKGAALVKALENAVKEQVSLAQATKPAKKK